MRVTSDLADLQIELGRITRDGDELVVESAPGSSLDASIRVDGSDARNMLGKLLKSGAVWGFLLRLPFVKLKHIARSRRERWRPALGEGGDTFAPGSGGKDGDNPAWRERREGTGLNKPW